MTNRIECEVCLNSYFDDQDRLRCYREKCEPDYEDMREARTNDGWIPLEFGVFPGNGDKVLVSVSGREMPDMAIYKEEKYGQGGAFYFAHMKDIKFLDLGDIVTAWMPLPEPYSVETPGES